MKHPFLILIVTILMAGCSSSEKAIDKRPVDILYQEAEAAFSDERYLIAEEKFKLVFQQYPYSQLAPKAVLRLADVYYNQERYAEAGAQYRSFTELHPDNPKVPYATYRAGESGRKLLPEKAGRDHTTAQQAIMYYSNLIQGYPDSEYVDEAKKRITEIRVKLAEKELYVADWYQGQERYVSAIGRYENVLKTYSGLGLDQRALSGLVSSYYGLIEKGDEILSRARPEFIESIAKQSRQYARSLLDRFPNDASASEAKEMLN